MLRTLGLTLLATLFLVGSVGTPQMQAAAEPVAATEEPLVFKLRRPLFVGERTRVRLKNLSDVTYVYNSAYEACEMVFRELPSRRQFIVPEGTHCDLIVMEELEPGETVTLFRWDLDECVEDNWGCTKAKDLPAGRYQMRGWFEPKGGGDEVRVTKRFRIHD